MSPPTPEELAARRAAEQAAKEHAAAAQAAANAAAQQAAQEAAQRLAAQEAANRLAAERLVEEAARLRLERSLQEPMDVDVAMMQKQRVEEEINQYFMNGLRPDIKAEMTKQSTYRGMDIDEKIQLAMQVEFSMTPTTFPMAEMGQQATKETEKEGEEKKGLEELTQEEFKKQLSAMNRHYNQRFGNNGNGQRGNNRGRGRGGNNQRGAQSYRGNTWNQSHGNQGGRWNNGNTRGGYQNNFQTNSYNGRGGYQNKNGGRGGYQSYERRRIKCFRCRKFGYHTAQNCPIPNSDLASLVIPGKSMRL